MGYAAALSSVGIEAEAGGSAISTLFINMLLGVRGRRGGRGLRAGRRHERRRVPATVPRGRRGGHGRLRDRAGQRHQGRRGHTSHPRGTGITEIRQRDATLRLAKSGDLLSNAIRTANDAWIENNALTNEANKRYETAASRFQLAKNDLNDLAIENRRRVAADGRAGR